MEDVVWSQNAALLDHMDQTSEKKLTVSPSVVDSFHYNMVLPGLNLNKQFLLSLMTIKVNQEKIIKKKSTLKLYQFPLF